MLSHWLQQALASDREVAPCLEGEVRADVCIVGGGYAGLWTALELKHAEPGLDVVLVEAGICGGGASGRNAGYLVDLWVKFPVLEQRVGADEALRLCRASEAAVDEIAAFCRDHGIDAHLRTEGWLWSATSKAELGAWNAVVEALERHQVHVFEIWDRAKVEQETCFAAELGGAFNPGLTTVQPALLARGLRRVAIERGVRIYENSPMRILDRARPPRVHTPRGRVTAERVVLTLNAWSLALPELRPAIVIVGADMAATPPMLERLAELGWTKGPAVVDSKTFANFFRATPDGHLTVGKGGGLLNFGSRIAAHYDGPARRIGVLRDMLARIHPSLASVEFAATWCGPIDRTKSGLPLFGRLPRAPDIFYGYGFSGNGIVPCRLGGRILSALVREQREEWAASALVRPPERDFPPEPMRYIGGQLVRAAIARKDRLIERNRRPDVLTRRLAALAPASFKPTS